MIVMALLEKICGNTFYMPGRANVGIFIGEKGRCTLIDAGLDDYVGKNVLRLAHQYDWQLEGIINTHGHADHCGGNSYLQNKTHVPVYATAPEAALMENPELEPYYLYSAAPIKELQIRFLKAKPSRVASIIDKGPFEISGAVFEILSLMGHSPGHAGIVTPDDVCFLGDAVCPKAVLEKYKIPYYDDIERALITLKRLKEMNHSYFVLAHGGVMDDIRDIVELNIRVLYETAEMIQDILTTPLTREGVVEALVNKLDIPLNVVQYYLVSASTAAYITYLCDEGVLEPIIDGSRLVWARRK